MLLDCPVIGRMSGADEVQTTIRGEKRQHAV
jgi:hypothetical protein